MTIGDRIKQLRVEKGMSQDELAKTVGYKSRSTVGKIELGKMDITQSSIVAIAKALGTTPEYLMGWEDTPATPAESLESLELAKKIERLSPENKKLVIELIEKLGK